MKKFLSYLVVACAALMFFEPVIAEAAKVRVIRRGPQYQRRVVVVQHGHPIRRAMRPAIAVRPGVTFRVAPARFLPLVVWTAAVVARPAPDRIVWQDAETLNREEDWSEVVFNSDQRGEQLYLEIAEGRVQLDFAEVVFENGECQVVDFNEKVHRPGVYSLLDFKDGRKIDHVRLVAQAKTEDARIVLLLRK